jgi:small subunit ribosomal protein S19
LSYSLYKKYFLYKNKYDFIKIYARNSMILTEFIGAHFHVYNGCKFLKIFITENKVGHKFGEFSFTRKLRKFIHSKDNLKKKNIKKK